MATSTHDAQQGSSEELSLSALLDSLPHLDLTGRVQEDNLMASGGFADVYHGTARLPGRLSDVRVAVKRFRVFMDKDKDFTKAITREIRIWSSLVHPNVLRLLGYTAMDGFPSLVSEWMDNGTVLSYMKRNPDTDVLTMIRGIAEGLRYLHEKGVIHSDLKSDNVLISPFGVPLLSDFGISRMLVQSNTVAGTSNLKGSYQWMAIELLDSSMQTPGQTHEFHTRMTDVWAFGMTVYELLTGAYPFAHLGSEVAVMLAIMQGSLPPQPGDCKEVYRQKLWELCDKCWNTDARLRPTVPELIQAIVALQESTKTQAQKASSQGEPMRVIETISAWNAKTRRLKPKYVYTSTPDPVFCAAFSPDQRYVATGTLHGAIKVWDVASGSVISEPPSGTIDAIWALAFSEDGQDLAASLGEGTIGLWDARTGQAVSRPLRGNSGRIRAITFASDGEKIILGADDGTVSVWDIGTGTLDVGPLKEHNNLINTVAASPFGGYFLSSSGDATIRIWNAETGELAMDPLMDHRRSVNTAAYSPDGRMIASGSRDGVVYLWDAQDGTRLERAPMQRAAAIQSLAFSPDGNFLAVYSLDVDDKLVVFDVRTGEVVSEILTQPIGLVYAVAFSRDGQHILAASNETIKVWKIDTF